MGNKIPIIKLKQEIKKVQNINPYINDNVCLIGAFETDTAYMEPTLVTTIDEARTKFGTDSTIDGNSAIEQILADDEVSSVLVVNITSFSGETAQRNLTSNKLDDAITALDLIDFDLLFIANDLSDAFITKINNFAQDRFTNKNPFGYIASISRSSLGDYKTTAGLTGEFCYALINQKINVNEDPLTLIESGAFITREIALSSIAESLTATVIPSITGLQDSYTFGTTDGGTQLTSVGYLLFRLINATTNTYETVNSANNTGLDLYINRVRDNLVRDMSLRQFLGDKSNKATIELIKMECNRIYTKFMELDLIEGMNFVVQKKDSETVEVIINSIQFAGIITEIDVYITIEVI